ncbi:hypothetical protein [uncultured Maribacter sp.]|uniref:hypothetical protein n=1 Tax=uncultured Maribacter sp. TaxID=431308 RepID=UPI0030DA74D5|tara:strand:- start:10299 stop:11429 length:1131 start_codon:yes stop_codon:yes gene_type:complete
MIFINFGTKRLIVFIFFITTLLFSCSNDDVQETENIQDLNLTIIGEDLQDVYQYNFESLNNIETQINLSSELGIQNNYLTLREFEGSLSFYSFSNGAISLTQKNLATGRITSFPDFYTISAERSLVWGINDENSVYFGLYKPLGSTNLTLRVVSFTDMQGFDISLEFGISSLFEPLYDNGNLFITYLTGSENYKLLVYNVNAKAIVKTFEFGKEKPSFLITDLGDLAVFTQDVSNNTKFELFDPFSFLSISNSMLPIPLSFPAGPINGSIVKEKLYYQYVNTQPFEIENGPAFLDLNSGDNTILDIVGLINKVNNDEGILIRPLFGQYLSDINLFAISYALQNAVGEEIGGFLLVSLDGNLVVKRNLKFLPTHFVE